MMGKRWLAGLSFNSLLTLVLLTCGTLAPAALGTAGTALPRSGTGRSTGMCKPPLALSPLLVPSSSIV